MNPMDPKLKIRNLISRAEKNGINIVDLAVIKSHPSLTRVAAPKKYLMLGVTIAIVLTMLYLALHTRDGDECIIEMPAELSKAFRPPERCDFCENVNEVRRIAATTPDEFEEQYAYSGVPVIITDAIQNWTALQVFDFWYFKNIYGQARSKARQTSCQFFPYTSGFRTFAEALNIPPDRVNYEEGAQPWYFGWSNCNPQVAEVLRQHYGRPYFLPRSSENNAIDWIFMGGPGLGAHMHVDNVRLPSWQAQIRGSKEWTLAPPPECYYRCTFMKAKVMTGDIIVLDTNRWYHKTEVQPGEISITIGAEYD